MDNRYTQKSVLIWYPIINSLRMPFGADWRGALGFSARLQDKRAFRPDCFVFGNPNNGRGGLDFFQAPHNVRDHAEDFAFVGAGDGFGCVFGVGGDQVQTVAARLVDTV